MKAEMKAEVKERPILFSGPMVRGILDGRKTQTRRVVAMTKQEPLENVTWGYTVFTLPGYISMRARHANGEYGESFVKLKYGKPGDQLWVRETWYDDFGVDRSEIEVQLREGVYYRADGEAHDQFEDWADLKWRPSIFMPRWASRITLEITNVRVERLQDISEEDAKAEGVEGLEVYPTVRGQFARVWEKINGKKHPWESNPWVWVVEFRKL